MANNFYKAKTWNAICDSCGFKFKSSDLKKRWDGLMVDDACWEPRQPQDFLRAVQENSNHLPWTRPDTDGIDISPSYTTLYIDAGYFEEVLGVNLGQGTYFEEL